MEIQIRDGGFYRSKLCGAFFCCSSHFFLRLRFLFAVNFMVKYTFVATNEMALVGAPFQVSHILSSVFFCVCVHILPLKFRLWISAPHNLHLRFRLPFRLRFDMFSFRLRENFFHLLFKKVDFFSTKKAVTRCGLRVTAFSHVFSSLFQIQNRLLKNKRRFTFTDLKFACASKCVAKFV